MDREVAAQLAAASCLLGITHPSSRGYVDPKRIDFYDVSSRLRVLHVVPLGSDATRVEDTIEAMAAWYEIVKDADFGASAQMSAELWAAAVVDRLSRPPLSAVKSWEAGGFTEGARRSLARMVRERSAPKKALSNEQKEEVARLATTCASPQATTRERFRIAFRN